MNLVTLHDLETALEKRNHAGESKVLAANTRIHSEKRD